MAVKCNFLKNAILTLTVALFVSCGENVKQPIDYVNPYIGNMSHMLVPTFPTVHLPNGMMRVYPNRGEYTADLIEAIPLIVTSHRGRSSFMLAPFVGDHYKISADQKYYYENEKSTPYSYAVNLSDFDIDVEFAPSYQSGIYKLKFPTDGEEGFYLSTINGNLNVDGKVVRGFENLDHKTKVYIYAELDVEPQSVKTEDFKKGKSVIAIFPANLRELNIRYGVSFISEEQAAKNLKREIASKSIEEISMLGRNIWNNTLSKMDVKGGTEDQKSVFYTSLYRSYERMINISEDGNYYSGYDGNVHSDEGRNFYVDDWVWDTFRALHPLHTILNPTMQSDKVNSFVRMAEQTPGGFMPTFPEVTGDTHRMNGNHGVAVVWDAYVKGLRGFDLSKAYEASRKSIMEETMIPWIFAPATDLDDFYKKNGYFPALHPGEKETNPLVSIWEKRQSVAVTLAAAYDDWCMAQIAKELGKEDDYKYFSDRSYNYRNLFNAETGFFHPKDSKGQFILPFDYNFSGGLGARDYYDENNGYTYQWDVMHNFNDLVSLMGGKEAFSRNLDKLFTTPIGMNKFAFYAQLPDQTGNVGQFSMANEPSFHIPYLYNYVGESWKTQKRIRSLMDQWFRNDLMGIPGDEDGGGMTSFVVFSMAGFYPVTPGTTTYTIGSPIFEELVITLENGKKFKVVAPGASAENKYIQAAELNGKKLDRAWFDHKDIVDGGVLKFVMGPKPNKNWGGI